MTCLEKLKKDHPELSKETIDDIIKYECPHEYCDVDTPPYCNAGVDPYVCIDCWNRVVDSGSDVAPSAENKVVYLCDRQACENCSYPVCQHTLDISHAANFEEIGEGEYMEKGD